MNEWRIRGLDSYAKRLSPNLLKYDSMSKAQQKEHLRHNLLAWQGKLEQVDDILVIGVEV